MIIIRTIIFILSLIYTVVCFVLMINFIMNNNVNMIIISLVGVIGWGCNAIYQYNENK